MSKTTDDSYREKPSPEKELMAQIAMCRASRRAVDPSIFEGDVITLQSLCPPGVKEIVKRRVEDEAYSAGDTLEYYRTHAGAEPLKIDIWSNANTLDNPNYDPTQPNVLIWPKTHEWEKTDYDVWFEIIIEELGNVGMWFTQDDVLSEPGLEFEESVIPKTIITQGKKALEFLLAEARKSEPELGYKQLVRELLDEDPATPVFEEEADE